MEKKSISERAIIGFDHGLPCRVKNMALGPQLRQKPRPPASVFVYWVPRAMFFTRHGRPWSNPTAHTHTLWSIQFAVTYVLTDSMNDISDDALDLFKSSLRLTLYVIRLFLSSFKIKRFHIGKWHDMHKLSYMLILYILHLHRTVVFLHNHAKYSALQYVIHAWYTPCVYDRHWKLWENLGDMDK